MTIDPKIVDAELAALSEKAAKLELSIARAAENFHHYVGDRRVRSGRTSTWMLSDAEAEERAAAGTGVAPYEVRSVAMAFERRDADRAELQTVRARTGELNRLFREAGGWSRFFMVTDGHIHSSTQCHTCRVTTQFGWLYELAGDTEAEAVAAHGALLCTVCFPTAPVEWTNFYEVQEAAKQAARCPGSGQMYNPDKPHETRRNSKWGYCRECDTVQTVTPNGNIRAHKKG
jgi:hypothetical protein